MKGLFHNVVFAWGVVAVLLAVVVGLSVALATGSTSSVVVVRAPFGFGPNHQFSQGPGGRFSALGTIGTVTSATKGSFTLNAQSGGSVTIKEQASTVYGGRKANGVSSIVKGARVAVQGQKSADTIIASRVEVLPVGFGAFGPPGGGGFGSRGGFGPPS